MSKILLSNTTKKKKKLGFVSKKNVINPHAKTYEQRSSMISYFNFFLTLRQVKLDQQEIEGRKITEYKLITFKDLDQTAIVGE